MTKSERLVLDRLVKSGAAGGFTFMAVTCWLLAFDAGLVASMIADSASMDILRPLIIGGALTKGTVIGATIGIAGLTRSASEAQRTVV